MFFCALGFVVSAASIGVILFLAVREVVTLGPWPIDGLVMLDYRLAQTTAVILDKRLVPEKRMGPHHRWKVTFRFTTLEGRNVESAGYTYDQSFANKMAGEAVEIEYDLDNPRRACPVGGCVESAPPSVRLWGVLMLAPSALLLIAGVVMLVLVGVRSRSERKLLAYGVGTAAEVVRVKSVWYIHFGTRHPFDVHYRFQDHRGLEVAGRDRTYHYAWAAALKPGDKVGVVYHPRMPATNVLWLHGRDSPLPDGRGSDGW